MPDQEDFDLPDQDVPAVDIPDLKKKEKERKKAGAAWGGGRPAGAPFAGATGGQGAGVAARAAASAARAGTGAAAQFGAGAQAGFFSRLLAQLGGAFASLTATALGKALVLTAAALLAGGAVAIAYRMLAGGGPAGARPDLGGISSTVKVHREGDSAGLKYAARAGRGEIKWEGADKGAGPKTAEAGKDKPADDKDKNAEAGEGAPRDRTANDLAGAKLTSSLAGAFGAHDIFSGGSASRFGPSVGAGGGFLSKFGLGRSQLGKGGTLVKRPSLGSRYMNLRGIRTNKALAQLRGMTPYNAAMRSGTSVAETKADAASTQFDGTALQGGSPPAAPPAIDAVTPVGGPGASASSGASGETGAPDVTSTIEKCGYDQYWNGTICTDNTDVDNHPVTQPWDPMVEQSRTLVYLACGLLLASAILAAIGAGLAAVPVVGWSAYTACAAAAMALAGTALTLGALITYNGYQINSMGGAPQGDMFLASGGVIAAGGALAMVAAWVGGATWMVLAAVLIAVGVVAANVLGMLLGGSSSSSSQNQAPSSQTQTQSDGSQNQAP